MGRNPERLFDKTFLSIDQAEERQLVHRDYIAHCLRWSHTIKLLHKGKRYADAVIVDVGCGKEMPLAKALYTNKMSPKLYVGVDVNRFEVPEMLQGKKIPVQAMPETDFCSVFVKEEATPPEVPTIPEKADMITSFEVLEHVTPGYCRLMLQHMLELLKDDGSVVISTPCFNGEAAENHINEMTYPALGALLEDLGFEIVGAYGTFASISDYKHLLGDANVIEMEDGEKILTVLGAFNRLRDYYDTNLLAVLFAPLFPEGSRNCLWELRKANADYVRKFPPLSETPGPWSQHAEWQMLGGEQTAVEAVEEADNGTAAETPAAPAE